VKILLHTCCGPCTIFPVKQLRSDAHDVMGFFYRSNIHPYTECARREETLVAYAESISLKLLFEPGYELENFLRNAAFREAQRCLACYHARLSTTALFAKKGKFDAYSTTLLYSKFQNHDLLRTTGEAVGKKIGVPFYYHDFRNGWKEGIEESKKLEMYRQQYCGCIYSEKDRYFRKLKETEQRLPQ
jgi:predicted adenine nucleotide alpha hydrolase (AANH) superfamily ATPase